mgnify:CR=1 FL=1
MNTNKTSVIAIIVVLAILVFMGWFFWDILVYMLISLALCFLGQPIMRLLGKINVKGKQLSITLSAVITLFIIIAVLISAFYFIIPVILREVNSLLSVDATSLSNSFAEWLNSFDPFLRRFGFLGADENFATFVSEEMQRTITKIDMSNLVSDTFHVASTLLISVFCILFMTFFALKDHGIFFRMIKQWLPKRFHQNFENILDATGEQLSSYFVGVFIDMLIIAVIETLLCLVLKVPKALLIGTLGGLLNIIPFVGPVISAIIGVIISLTSLIASNPETPLIVHTIIKVIAVVVVAKGLDDFIFQPHIYGKRTHTHPLEIFIVILMAGYIGGVMAIFFAVPAYTLIRIIIKEFFGAYFLEEDLTNKTTNSQPVSEKNTDEQVVPVDQSGNTTH